MLLHFHSIRVVMFVDQTFPERSPKSSALMVTIMMTMMIQHFDFKLFVTPELKRKNQSKLYLLVDEKSLRVWVHICH